MNAPTIRFKEFYNEMFGEATLNDLVEVVDCQHSTAPITDSDTEFKMIRTSNVRNGRLIVNTMNSVEESVYEQWSSRGYLEPNDIILTREAPMGEVALIPLDKKEKFFLGQRCLQLKSKQSIISPGYMFFLLQSSTFKNHIRPLKSSGSTVSNIRIPELKKFSFHVPSKLEQNKVIAFLFELIKRIELQQEKVELLKRQKKGLMQKIFSQELWFKDEDGQVYPDWTTKELGDILKIRHGKDQKQIETKEGQYPILATGGVIGRTNVAIYDKPSVLIGRKGTINKPQFMDTPFWTVDTLFYSEILEFNSPKFIYFIFQNIEWYRYNESTGVPSLSASTIHKIKVKTPTFKEQKRIEELLSTLDNKIVLEQEKTKLLQIQKQAFMQQMFI